MTSVVLEAGHDTADVEREIERLKQDQAEKTRAFHAWRLRIIQRASLVLDGFFALQTISQDKLWVTGTVILSIFVMLVSIWFRVNRPDDLSWSKATLMLALVFSIGMPPFFDGMIQSAGVWVLAILPIVASSLYTRHGTLAWTLIAAGIVGLLKLGHEFSIGTSFQADIDVVPMLFSRGLSMSVFAMFSYLAVTGQEQHVKKMEQTRAEILEQHQASRLVNQAKSGFLARMSHEIRTPMNGLLGATDHLRAQCQDAEIKRSVDTVHRCAKNLLTLLNDALDLGKIEGGKLDIENRAVDLCALVNDIRVLFLAQCELVEIQLVAHTPAKPVWVMADATRIRQILSNLVGNAIKFSDKGTVSVELGVAAAPAREREEHPSVEVFITVKDQGIGMDEAQVERLFQKYEQVHGTTQAKRGGTGLGLAISKSLIESMRGTLEVESTVGQGSTFTLRCILARAQETQPSRSSCALVTDPSPQSDQGLILVVDDNAVNLKIAQLALKRLGYTSVTASNGQEAVECAAERPFAAILMDIRMPVMNGLDASFEIRSGSGVNRNTPIIALTANAYEEDRQRAKQSGIEGYIAKPFELARLREELERYVPSQPARSSEKGFLSAS